MTTNAARLGMLATEQLAFNHGDAADTRAQRHHDDVREAASCARKVLPQKRHASVILNAQGQIEFLAAPAAQIDVSCIVVLSVCCQHSRSARIHKASNSHRNSRDLLERETVVLHQSVQGIANIRQHCP